MANDDSHRTMQSASIDGKEEASTAETHQDSEELLLRIKEKYQRKQERLDELKDHEKKVRAAMVFTKRRYREVTAALKKGGNMISDAAFAAQNESVKLLDRTKAQARICGLNAKINEYLVTLGSEIYDCIALGVSNFFNNANIKKTLGLINECHVEIELIEKKFKGTAAEKTAKGK